MKTVKNAILEAIDNEMERDSTVFIIGEEVGRSGGPYGTTKSLLEKYGELRVVDTPISEIGFTGLAVGASYMGLRPIVDFMSWAFSLQAIDHIVNSCAKIEYLSNGRIRCPIVFRGPGGRNPGYAAEHTQEFHSLYGGIPGLTVVSPYTSYEHFAVFTMAIRSDGPVLILENECLYNLRVPDDSANINNSDNADICNDVVEYGKSRILKKGDDITVVGVSESLEMLRKAVARTSRSVELINLLFIRPLDVATILRSVKKTGRLIVVDYGNPLFGLCSEISAQIYSELFGELKQKIRCFSGLDSHVPYAKDEENRHYPREDEIIKAIEEMCGLNK